MLASFLSLVFLLPIALGVPEHGNNMILVVNSTDGDCTSMTMTSFGVIKAKLFNASIQGNEELNLNITIELYESQCEAIDKKNCKIRTAATSNHLISLTDELSISIVDASSFHHSFNFSWVKPLTVESPKTDRSIHRRNTEIVNTIKSDDDGWYTCMTGDSSGVYDVVITAHTREEKSVNYQLFFEVDMKNSYGYLSLVDYPALIVFSILLVLYVGYAIGWLVTMAINYKDLVRLQFWILAVILLGFLEKVFFVAEYGSANTGMDSSGLIYVAEGVSAAKRALARVLVIIVCEGFGTVKPRLGNLLTKVAGLGAVYFMFAFVDGVLRGSRGTGDYGLATTLTFGLLFLIDVGIVYWIFTALINTRRALRIRNNLVKLSLYNHLGYALIATVLGSLAFIVWQFVYITRSTCTNDWREMWLIECFWHMLFCFMLFIIMVIWRPSANKLRFAYTQVLNGDSEEEEEEQGVNKNFENVKMRPVNAITKQPLTSMEADEDLKWVEQNLPTTAIDKAAQIVLDSEEEVMTTRYEASKIN